MLPTSRFFAGDDIEFTEVAESAATATEGQLVVYRIGRDCPSQLVADALARGAAGILTEQVLPCPLPQCIVGDVDASMDRITAATLDHPDRKLLTIAVTGSAGKTTTALLIASLMKSCGIRVGFQSDLGSSDGVVESTSQQTKPSGSRLIQWLSEVSDSECQAVIVEIDDQDARDGKYDAIEFDLLVVTGSSSGSGDYGPTALQCLLDLLTVDGVVIAPVDDAKVSRVVKDAGVSNVTYGVRKAADVTAKIIDQSGGMSTLMVSHQDTSAMMETALCGAAMAADNAAAITVGLLLANPLHEVVEKVGSLRAVPGRGQRHAAFDRADGRLNCEVSFLRFGTRRSWHGGYMHPKKAIRRRKTARDSGFHLPVRLASRLPSSRRQGTRY